MMNLMARILEKLQPYIPLLQTLVWPIFIAMLLIVFHKQAGGIVEAIRTRIERGSSFKAGPFEIGEALKSLEYAQPTQESSQNSNGGKESWKQEREQIYQINKGLFLTHIITPSKVAGQKYDIYIYLIQHKTNTLSEVQFAEFYFGPMWGNKVFKEYPKQGLIGISTSAYGPFLCTCRVHLKDGSVIFLTEYIDFEMAKVIDTQQGR